MLAPHQCHRDPAHPSSCLQVRWQSGRLERQTASTAGTPFSRTCQHCKPSILPCSSSPRQSGDSPEAVPPATPMKNGSERRLRRAPRRPSGLSMMPLRSRSSDRLRTAPSSSSMSGGSLAAQALPARAVQPGRNQLRRRTAERRQAGAAGGGGHNLSACPAVPPSRKHGACRHSRSSPAPQQSSAAAWPGSRSAACSFSIAGSCKLFHRSARLSMRRSMLRRPPAECTRLRQHGLRGPWLPLKHLRRGWHTSGCDGHGRPARWGRMLASPPRLAANGCARLSPGLATSFLCFCLIETHRRKRTRGECRGSVRTKGWQ